MYHFYLFRPLTSTFLCILVNQVSDVSFDSLEIDISLGIDGGDGEEGGGSDDEGGGGGARLNG